MDKKTLDEKLKGLKDRFNAEIERMENKDNSKTEAEFNDKINKIFGRKGENKNG